MKKFNVAQVQGHFETVENDYVMIFSGYRLRFF